MWNRIGQNKQLDANLYLAWGSDEEERFLTSNQEMTDLLESRAYQGFRFESVMLDGRDHDGTIFPGIRYGLIWVFSEKE
jgi:hypothetical protein